MLCLISLLAASKGTTIPIKYSNFKDIFLEKNADKLPLLEGCQHPIILEEGTIPPYSPIYNLFKTKLKVL